MVERREVGWSDARWGGVTLGLTGGRKVVWGDARWLGARCGEVTRAGVTRSGLERREVGWSGAR